MTADRDDLEYLLAGYALGDLSPEELADLQQLLQTTPELHQELERYQETLALLPLALPEYPPALELRERTLSRGEVHGGVTAPSRIPSKRPVPGLVLLALGLGATIALLGIDSIVLRRQMAKTQMELEQHRETVAMLSQPRSRIVSLQGMGVLPTAAGRLVVTDQKTTIAIRNLMPPLPGKSYHLWGIRDGQKFSCGQLTPDGTGTVYKNIVSDRALIEATTFIVTIEPAAEMPQPTGDPVMMGSGTI